MLEAEWQLQGKHAVFIRPHLARRHIRHFGEKSWGFLTADGRASFVDGAEIIAIGSEQCHQ